MGPNAIQIFVLRRCVLPRFSSSNKSMESRKYKELRQRDRSFVLQGRHLETSLVNQSDLGKPKQHSKLTARGFQIYRIISCSFDLIKSGNSFNYLIVGRGRSDIPKSGEIFVWPETEDQVIFTFEKIVNGFITRPGTAIIFPNLWTISTSRIQK